MKIRLNRKRNDCNPLLATEMLINIAYDIFGSTYDCMANIFEEVELYDKLVTIFNKIKKIVEHFPVL